MSGGQRLCHCWGSQITRRGRFRFQIWTPHCVGPLSRHQVTKPETQPLLPSIRPIPTSCCRGLPLLFIPAISVLVRGAAPAPPPNPTYRISFHPQRASLTTAALTSMSLVFSLLGCSTAASERPDPGLPGSPITIVATTGPKPSPPGHCICQTPHLPCSCLAT